MTNYFWSYKVRKNVAPANAVLLIVQSKKKKTAANGDDSSVPLAKLAMLEKASHTGGHFGYSFPSTCE